MIPSQKWPSAFTVKVYSRTVRVFKNMVSFLQAHTNKTQTLFKPQSRMHRIMENVIITPIIAAPPCKRQEPQDVDAATTSNRQQTRTVTKKKSVSFGEVRVREHEVILGNYPPSSCTVTSRRSTKEKEFPLMLGWQHANHAKVYQSITQHKLDSAGLLEEAAALIDIDVDDIEDVKQLDLIFVGGGITTRPRKLTCRDRKERLMTANGWSQEHLASLERQRCRRNKVDAGVKRHSLIFEANKAMGHNCNGSDSDSDFGRTHQHMVT
jgi:hypothetical protein